MSKSIRRRQFLVNPKFQLTFIGFNLILALVAVFIFYLENVYLYKLFLDTESPEMKLDPIIVQIAEEHFSRFKMVFLATSAAVFAAMFAGGLILSNRVAGPVYRLHKHLTAVVNGETKEDVKFRDKDFFPELAVVVNRLLELYRKK